MPIATYKLYKCQQCKAEKTIFQGDCITSFPTCPKCGCIMEFKGDANKSVFRILKNILGVNKI
jgi:predicted nucleic acid-binding Zn ribbon protein